MNNNQSLDSTDDTASKGNRRSFDVEITLCLELFHGFEHAHRMLIIVLCRFHRRGRHLVEQNLRFHNRSTSIVEFATVKQRLRVFTQNVHEKNGTRRTRRGQIPFQYGNGFIQIPAGVVELLPFVVDRRH